MEIRDLYDENRNITGETIGNEINHIKSRYVVVVVIFIQNSKGEFLIQKTSKEKGNKWATTGGHLLRSESSFDAIIREVKEELGIDLSNTNIEFYGTMKKEFVFVDQYYVNTDIDINDMILQKEEVEDVQWASVLQIKELISNNEFHKSHATYFHRCLEYLKNK